MAQAQGGKLAQTEVTFRLEVWNFCLEAVLAENGTPTMTQVQVCAHHCCKGSVKKVGWYERPTVLANLVVPGCSGHIPKIILFVRRMRGNEVLYEIFIYPAYCTG